jgi:hypothetical protein
MHAKLEWSQRIQLIILNSVMLSWNGVYVYQLFSYMDWNPFLYMSDEAESHAFRVGMESMYSVV